MSRRAVWGSLAALVLVQIAYPLVTGDREVIGWHAERG